MKRAASAGWIVVAVALSSTLASAELVPARLASLLLLKVLNYEPAVAGERGDFVILVIGGAEQTRQFLADVRDVENAKLQQRTVHFVSGPGDLTGLEAATKDKRANALMVCPGFPSRDLEGLQKLAVAGHLYTMTVAPEEYGRSVAFGVKLKEGRPQIVINVPVARALGMQLDMAVLKVAELIQ
jgi:hypothetical protein